MVQNCLIAYPRVRGAVALALVCSTVVWQSSAVRADMVLEWNEIASNMMLENEVHQNPGMASRSQAMVNLAMYDAINGITGARQTFYEHPLSPDAGASVEAAAASAAHHVLSAIYTDQQDKLDTALAASLGSITDIAARDRGRDFGSGIGANVAAIRANDGFDEMVEYTPQGGPGNWAPDPLNPDQEAWGPGWGSVRPFALQNPGQHMPRPAPDMTTQEYADAFNEVKELGAIDSATRTEEQTKIGLFWAYDRVGMGTPMRMYNGILRTIAEEQGNDLQENAELFAMATTAVADAGIVAWDAKFENDLWRPVTGIREADTDGNPLTEADEDWTPLGAPGGGEVNDFTPPFPTYISGHATFGGALFQSIANYYGTDDIEFVATSDETPGYTRTFTSLSEAMAENGRSRVYLGIHWNYDDIDGQLAGQSVANEVFSRAFVAVPEPATGGLVVVGLAAGLLVVRLRRR